MIKSITDSVISKSNTPEEKLHKIFDWVRHNISYDFKSANDDAIYIRSEQDYADATIRSRTAICYGYAVVMREMLRSAGIRSEVVTGYGRAMIEDLYQDSGQLKHAWNAVELPGGWVLVDATWAAAMGNGELSEYFIKTPAQEFNWSHFPFDSQWTLTNKPLTRDQFFNAPIKMYYRVHEYGLDIQHITGLAGWRKIATDTLMIPVDVVAGYELDFEWMVKGSDEPIVPEKSALLSDDRKNYILTVPARGTYTLIISVKKRMSATENEYVQVVACVIESVK